MKRYVSKNFCAKILGVLVFLFPCALAGWQSVSLDDETSVFKESGSCFLEHALFDYHHYYLSAFNQKILDVAVSPFFEKLMVIEGNRHSENMGAFLQTQFNFNDIWVRLNTVVGALKEKKKGYGFDAESSVSGFDDVVIKVGSDNFSNGSDHVGIYFLCGFPVKSEIIDLAIPDSSTHPEHEFDLFLKTPRLGIGNYRVGTGLNGGWSLSQGCQKHLAFLADFQYYYSIGRTLQADFKPITDLFGFQTYVEKERPARGEIKLTPGHTIEVWSALHYDYCNIGIECGALFSTTFGLRCYESDLKAVREKSLPEVMDNRTTILTRINFYNDKIVDFEAVNNKAKVDEYKKYRKDAQDLLDTMPKGLPAAKSTEKELSIKGLETIKFGVQPYLALSYGCVISSVPFTLGAGAGYEYCQTRKEAVPNSLHGFVAWGTLEASF